MDNDTGFADDVTVTVTTLPTKGTAVVSGSPGPQAGIVITYTANIGATGADSFVYTVLDADGVTTDTATVTLAVGLGAKDDTATTTRNQPVDINVGSQRHGLRQYRHGDDRRRVLQCRRLRHGHGGFGPAHGVVVTYTPVSAVNTPGYAETFIYTIDDGVLPPDTATVNVTVNNRYRLQHPAHIAIDTAGSTRSVGLAHSPCPAQTRRYAVGSQRSRRIW